MKRTLFSILACIILASLIVGFGPPAERKPIAQAVKLIHDVNKKTPEIDWASVKKGDFLASGDQVRTEKNSIAIVRFLDGSLLRVRESSELKLLGEVKDGKFNKTVNVTRGEFTFDIQHQTNEAFTFSSPTSVAAIRGTEGVMGHDDNGDVLTVVEGLVNFLNAFSNQSVNIGTGQTGVSNNDGTISVHQSTPGESSSAQAALDAVHGTGTVKQLDIELKDAQGKKKDMRIKYHN